jgi:hypothetical protein
MRIFLSSTFKGSLTRNFTVLFIAWLVFFPGFYSGDSFGAVQMARTGEFTNSGTASWALYVRIFSIFGNAIGLLTLVGGLLLVLATTLFAYSVFHSKTASFASLVMCLSPLIWGMGLTLWHDILMTSGLLLLTSFMVKIHLNQSISKLDVAAKLILGSVLISFRPNGLPVLMVFSMLFLIFIHKREAINSLLGAISVTALTTLIGSVLILGMSPINDFYAQEWMRNDISCFANTSEGMGFVERNVPGIGTTDRWKSPEACVFLNGSEITREEFIQAQEFVPSAWLKLLKQDPIFILDTHLKRNAYLVPFPFHGFPEPPFLHSTIEYEFQGIKWAFPAIADNARAPMRIWNLFRGITAWAGLWSLVTLILLLCFRQKQLLAPMLLAVSLMGVLFVFAPIPDGRYALFVLIVGQLAFIGKLVEWAQTGSNRRPTD